MQINRTKLEEIAKKASKLIVKNTKILKLWFIFMTFNFYYWKIW